MTGKLIIEILILWVVYALYMAVLVHKRGPVGGIFFYPQVMINRVKELGLITEEELKHRKISALLLLIGWMLTVPAVMILGENGARSYFECCFQYYILFLGAEFFDWLILDTIWVALSDWWIIPGTEDLNDTWHNVNIKKWKMLKLIPLSVPIAAIVGGIYWLIGKLM